MRACLNRCVIALLLVAAAAGSARAEDRRLVGVWRAVSYLMNGTTYPLQGLLIFTDHYYSGNTRFKTAPGPNDDANGNAGPYTADGRKVVFTQWVQIHVRPADAANPILSIAGPDEATDYRIEGSRLILTFPSKNEYVLERIDP